MSEKKIRLGPVIHVDLYKRLQEICARRGISLGTFIRELLVFIARAEEGDRLILVSESDYVRFVREGERLPPTLIL